MSSEGKLQGRIIRQFTMRLPVPLTDDELVEKSDELSQVVIDRATLMLNHLEMFRTCLAEAERAGDWASCVELQKDITAAAAIATKAEAARSIRLNPISKRYPMTARYLQAKALRLADQENPGVPAEVVRDPVRMLGALAVVFGNRARNMRGARAASRILFALNRALEDGDVEELERKDGAEAWARRYLATMLLGAAGVDPIVTSRTSFARRISKFIRASMTMDAAALADRLVILLMRATWATEIPAPAEVSLETAGAIEKAIDAVRRRSRHNSEHLARGAMAAWGLSREEVDRVFRKA
jgi:hypothetical protein